MGYASWFDTHANKHKAIVGKLLKEGYDKEAVIEYFDFENMVQKEPEFCPLYAKNQKCHEMSSLNCYLCACPNFRFNDEGIEQIQGKTKYSFCAIDSKDGRAGVYANKIHQDCSLCQVPHTQEYVRKHFEFEWSQIMKKCPL